MLAECADYDAVAVDSPLLAELCRLALEVMDAPEVEMPSRRGPRFDGPTLTIGTAAAEKMGLAGQRVRLVRVEEG
jgi:hypothetical protein